MLSSLLLLSSNWVLYLLIFFSPTSFPSAINNTLSVFAATLASWVTSRIVVPCLLISVRMDIISAVALESNAPVGSSPKFWRPIYLRDSVVVLCRAPEVYLLPCVSWDSYS